jgi:hypothetical protein
MAITRRFLLSNLAVVAGTMVTRGAAAAPAAPGLMVREGLIRN